MSGAEGLSGETTGSSRSFIARQFPPFTSRQWRVFAIAFTAGFFDNYDDALLSLALRQIQRGLSVAEANLGTMLSVIRLGYVLSLLITPIADVFGRRRLLLYTIVGYSSVYRPERSGRSRARLCRGTISRARICWRGIEYRVCDPG